MGKLKSYSGSLFEERGLVINLKLYTGGGAHKREREGGLVRNYQSCGFRRKGSIFLTFPLKKKKRCFYRAQKTKQDVPDHMA